MPTTVRRRFNLLVIAAVVLAAPAMAGKTGKAKRPASPPPAAAPSRRSPPDVRVPQNSDADPAASASSQPAPGTPSRGPARIDFDDRLIQGQTNKSGAVYLYDRKELKQRSMVKVRESFREEIIRTVYDR